MKKTLRRGILLVLAILLVCAAAAALIANRAAGEWVVVRVDTVETARYPLSADGEYELNGGTNTLVIENRQAYVSHADCPDKLCVNQGRIRGSGQMIVCLPNRVTVTIEGVSSGVDMVS